MAAMKNFPISFLESKLKRHGIPFIIKEERIIIGKRKTDYLLLIGTILLPLLVSGILMSLILGGTILKSRTSKGLLTLTALIIFAIAVVSLTIRIIKSKNNKTIKSIGKEGIIIKSRGRNLLLDAKNVKRFEYLVVETNEENFEGQLYLVEIKGRKHQLLRITDEDPKYVLNDLKWFANYLNNYSNLNLEDSTSESSITMSFSSGRKR